MLECYIDYEREIGLCKFGRFLIFSSTATPQNRSLRDGGFKIPVCT
jgi:hypothetical protein